MMTTELYEQLIASAGEDIEREGLLGHKRAHYHCSPLIIHVG